MVNRPQIGFATPFRPGQFDGAAAIWFDIPANGLRENAPNGKFPPADTVDFDAWVFNTVESVKAGKPDTELKNHTINKKGYVRQLRANLGQQFVAKPDKAPTNSGNDAFVLSDVTDEIVADLEKWWAGRNEDRKAALASAPDFLK